MARTLSPILNAMANLVWTLGFILVIFVLDRTAGISLNDRPILYALFLVGPVVSAIFCDRFSGILLGVLGLGTGVFLAAAALSLTSVSVAWSRTAIIVALILIADLAVSISLWWCVRRLRRRVPSTVSAS